MILNFIHWNVDPEIINFHGISIRYYGILFAGGLILCIYVLNWMFKREKIPVEYLDKLTIYGFIGILVGARLGHCLFYEPSYFLHHPVEMFLPVQRQPDGGYTFTGYQGLASHGGALGLIIALVIYSRKTKQSIIRTIDMIGVVAPLGGCFIRLGNLMNSEIIGVPTSKSWGFIFSQVDNIPRHPAQLYEAMSYLLIFILLILLYRNKRRKLPDGFFFGLSLSLIFLARFFIEFIKEPQVAFETNMTLDMGQLLSIPFVLTGIGFIGWGYWKKKYRQSES